MTRCPVCYRANCRCKTPVEEQERRERSYLQRVAALVNHQFANESGTTKFLVVAEGRSEVIVGLMSLREFLEAHVDRAVENPCFKIAVSRFDGTLV